ncbi:MAG: type IV pili twitching motility protein PilT [Proteobacteria bacterium]|nr:MAG: type IV pili twitching motility protein PilT [Pseudomonadota bacterium]PIE19960.1 MAG: type IV pili twitching motility protein PilT [Pseudomonadota bacterium]
MADIDQLLSYLREHNGSDLHLAANLAPRVRISGQLERVPDWPPIDDGALREMVREIAPQRCWDHYEQQRDSDFAYGLADGTRFRVNAFVQQNGAGAVLRIIPDTIVPLDQLGLPEAINELVHLRKGLVLVTGPTGSGKSTTLAAIIDGINKRYPRHIVTIEDPIEFVHRDIRSLVTQREVHQHTRSFAAALKAALRQNPDVVLVGELRDEETIDLAVKAAEMGVLVFGTLHTNSAVKTIDRLVDAFPSNRQSQVRLSLSESLEAVVAQLLLRTVDGERCAANEILLRTTALPNIIREGKTPQLKTVIESGKAKGMQSMDDALEGLVKAGTIGAEDAYRKAEDKPRFERLL